MSSQVETLVSVPQRAEDERSFTFVLLAILLFLLFFRPADLFKGLQPLHLALLFAVICLFSHFISSQSRSVPIVRFTPITKMLFALTLWALIGIPFAHWQMGAFMTFVDDWLKMLMFYLLLANVMFAVRHFRIAIWICSLSATFVSITAIINYLLHGADPSQSGRLTALVNGPYAGANYFSVTIVLMLPFLLFEIFLNPRFLVRAVSFVCTGILMVANLMTQSRAGVCGMVLVSLAVLWNLRNYGKSLAKIALIVAIATPVALLVAPHSLWDRFSTLFKDYDVDSLGLGGLRGAAGSQRERLQLIYKAVTLTAQNPVFGVGMGDFSSASSSEWKTGSGRDFVQTHNTYLQYSAELGVPGIALYIVLLVMTFRTIRLARDQIPEGGPGTKPYMLKVILDATKVSFFGYCLTSAFANVGYQPYYFFVAGVAQAAALAVLKVTANEPEIVPRPAPAWPPEPAEAPAN